MFIPGGGFTSVKGTNTMAQRMAFAEAGYVVACVQHRVLPTTFPTPLQDIKAAIRFLKANATKYGIDKNKVAVAGNSAGGYFATMVGVTSNTKSIPWPNRQGKMEDTKLDVGSYLEESSAVNAVIDLYGVSDLTLIGAGLPQAIEEGHHSASTTEAILLDGAAAAKKGVDVFENTTKAPIASPFTYIDKNDPPFLMMHGDKDTLVSPLASFELYNRLTAAGVTAERYTVTGAAHGGDMFAQPAALKMMTDFLDKYATVDIPAETEGAYDTSKAACGQDTIEATLDEAIAQNPVSIEVTDWNISEHDGIAYKTTDRGDRLYLDVLQPAKRGDTSKRPLLIWINGGGFTGSSPTGYLGIRYKYAKAGYVVASIQHRTVPNGVLPAPLQDAKQAVRYMRAHADKYGIDKNKVAAFGASAGGYFATMLGVTGNTKSIKDADGKVIELDTGDYLDESSAVNAVVDFYGVSDLSIIGAGLGEEMEDTHTSASNTEALLVNGTAFGGNKGGSVLDFPEKTALYSPFTYIDKDDPAFIMFHGDKDTSVSPVASMELKKRLLEAGLVADRTTITGSGHGGDMFYQDEITSDVIAFLNKQLG